MIIRAHARLRQVTGLSIPIRRLSAASLAGIKMATSGPPFYAAAQCAFKLLISIPIPCAANRKMIVSIPIFTPVTKGNSIKMASNPKANVDPKLLEQLSKQLNVPLKDLRAAAQLLAEGATIPFIARYRKEATNSLDEVALSQIRDGVERLEALEARRSYILQTIEDQGKLDAQLKRKIEKAATLTALEDLYLPYRPKRRTRATIAREKGLEGLAEEIKKQINKAPSDLAKGYINKEKGVESVEDALQGARDIIAEQMSEDAQCRNGLRRLFGKSAFISSRCVRGKEEEGDKYRDYFDWRERLNRVPSHRLLAMLRGMKEGFLRISIEPREDEALDIMDELFLTANNDCAYQVEDAMIDAYRRLLQPSIETESKQQAKEQADKDAIEVFASNLRELLLAAPLGQKRVMGLDPGYRTGCKLVVLDELGELKHYSTIYPHDKNSSKRYNASEEVLSLVKAYKIEAICIGNGTAGRETEHFIKKLGIEGLDVLLVDESGASIYSASEVARQEFPDLDLTVRGSVSIARRAMDPLAELVKIDPKSIGVGQYQHDVNQKALQKSLDDVVMSCVNAVGVEVNTASEQLLTYVSGVGPKLAKNIVQHRADNGPFKKKSDLKKVKGLGPKAFEQSAGFLRIRDAKQVLDRTAVHPERFDLVKTIAKDLKCTVQDLVDDQDKREGIPLSQYVTAEVGIPTLTDILKELAKPGRDPREAFEAFQFAEVHTIDDLYEGMILPGIVTNVTNFGAFVDLGIKENGLIHISQLSDQFVKDPKKIIKVKEKVTVKVLSLDIDRKRIQLTKKGVNA